MLENPNSYSLSPGSMIQEYKIEKILGEGNFGIVYLASNIYLDEIVAIKEFLPTDLASRSSDSIVTPLSPSFEEPYTWALDRFLKEAEILWKLGKPHPHPNIIEVKRFNKEHGTAYMVMPYEEGISLLDKINNQDAMEQDYLKSILLQLLDGLEKVHSCSVLHRDIKPSNILIRPDGSPVLIDFGAARRDFVNHDQSTMAIYSPMYAALEQITSMGEQGPWTDIYGLGATFYHVLSGKAPTYPVARIGGAAHIHAVDLLNNEYDLNFLKAIDAAIETYPKDRLQTISEFRTFLQSDDKVTPSDKTVIRTPNPPDINHPAPKNLIILTAIIVFSFIFLGWMKYWNPWPSSPISIPNDEPQPNINRITLLSTIQSFIEKIDCANLKFKLSDDYNVQVFGYVGSEKDRTRLGRNLKSVEGVKRVETDIVVYEYPFCSAVGLLNNYGLQINESDDNIKIDFNNFDRLYRTGEFLVINARTSKLYDGYFYIDYLDSNDHVVTHLFPSPVKPNNLMKANEIITLGTNRELSPFENNRSYKLLNSGNNLVMIIYSKNILFEKTRPEEEPIENYLLALEKALKKVPNRNSLLYKFAQLTIEN